MYGKKTAGQRMEPWEILALTGYSCEEYLTCNSIRLKFMKKTRMPNHDKSLGYNKCYSLSSHRPIKCLSAILSDATVKRSAVDGEDLKPHWTSEKKVALL